MGAKSNYQLGLPSGRRFQFDAGCLCLEFAMTGGEGEYQRFELFRTPADLARWMAESQLGVEVEGIAPADLLAAKRLREAIWRVATSILHSRRPRRVDLAALNEAAARPALAPRIDEAGGNERSWARPCAAGQALSTIARDAIDLFTGPLAGRIRECAGPTCSLIFLDTSRPGTRRWCSMERCGNWAKLRGFRERRRAADREGPVSDTGGASTGASAIEGPR